MTSLTRKLLRAILYLIYLIGGSLITFSFKPHGSFLDALLFSIVTVTTVGYGDVTPNTNLAKWLVVAYVLLGSVLSVVFGNPPRDFVNVVGYKLEKCFFQAIKTTSDKRKQIWKFFFAIGWILSVVITGIIGIRIWDLSSTTNTNCNGVNETIHDGVNTTNHNGVNETQFSVVNATYFAVVSAYTIGYGDFHFSATGGKWFALVWLPLGTAIVGSATSYLCGHMHLCAVCIWNSKKTRIVPGQELDEIDLVEANPTLRKHCLEHTNVENSLKFLSAVLCSRIFECEFAQRRGLEPAHECSFAFSSALKRSIDITQKRRLLPEVEILLKREDCCPEELGESYRWRGIYNFMANALNEMQSRAFICTVGKHAVTVACVAKLLDSEPRVAAPLKYFSAGQDDRDKIKAVLDKLQCHKTLRGACLQEADDHAKRIAKNLNLIYVPSCDHSDIITGYGTIGFEIITQMVREGKIDNLHAIFVPIGDGNCIAGIASYVKRVYPKVKVFGVEERSRCVMAWSFHKGKRVLLQNQNGEVLTEAIGEECFSLCAEFLDGIIMVDEQVISTAKELVKRDTIKKVSALCIAGVQCYCTKYVQEVRNKTIVAVIDEYENVLT